jgi:hypothetical protein
MGAKTKAEREKDARSFIARYNSWATGHGFRYEVIQPDPDPRVSLKYGKVLDACGGFYDVDAEYMIKEHILPAVRGHSYKIVGDASEYLPDLEDHEEPVTMAQVVAPWVEEQQLDSWWAL